MVILNKNIFIVPTPFYMTFYSSSSHSIHTTLLINLSVRVSVCSYIDVLYISIFLTKLNCRKHSMNWILQYPQTHIQLLPQQIIVSNIPIHSSYTKDSFSFMSFYYNHFTHAHFMSRRKLHFPALETCVESKQKLAGSQSDTKTRRKSNSAQAKPIDHQWW